MSHVKTNGARGVYTPTSVFSLNFWGVEKEGIAVFAKTNCLPSPAIKHASLCQQICREHILILGQYCLNFWQVLNKILYCLIPDSFQIY